ncbi:antibiotic biosynthesis monooxygenase family protein [Rhodovibrionaceae bacterium A322]
MYIAMNRFRVDPSRAEEFEKQWAERDSYLSDVPGFIKFHLLKGPGNDEEILYSSHVMWETFQSFEDWTKSESFRKAHAGAGKTKGIILGHPQFEGFEVIQSQ